MQVTKNSIKTAKGPSDWFTGDVYIDTAAAPSGASRLSASVVHFTPGGRTAWHTHPNGQTIFVIEGVGLAPHRGGQVAVDVDDKGNNATWGDHVSDEEYAAAPSVDGS